MLRFFGDLTYAHQGLLADNLSRVLVWKARELPLRIIAGKYRGRNLKSPPSMQVRPTSDRLRETLFNVIAPRIQGTRVLDLCAGSGAIGIEALSRGAAHVTFVDRSRKMCGLIESNLDLVRIPEDETEVVQSEAEDFTQTASASGRGDNTHHEPWIWFTDPPYATDYLGVPAIRGRAEVCWRRRLATWSTITRMRSRMMAASPARILKQIGLSFWRSGEY